MTGISVSVPGDALLSIISDNSNSGVFLAIQDGWQSFELFAGGPLVGVNTFKATLTCALYDELFVHTRMVVWWLRGGMRLLSYGCYTLNWLDISSNRIYANLETLGPLVASSLCSDATAQSPQVSKST